MRISDWSSDVCSADLARAQILRLRYAWDGDAIRLQARDDGRGTENPNAGNGLAGMRERLATYGGELEVESAPGQGFALSLRLPRGSGAGVGKPVPPRPVAAT